MAAPCVVLVRNFTYRGASEDFSGKYHFVGSAPSTPADWRSLCDALIALEKNALANTVHITHALCYASDGSPTVYSYDLSAFGGIVQGTYNPGSSGGTIESGDTAYMIRWNTGRLNSKGKPVYLRKYYHPGVADGANVDNLAGALRTACQTFGAAVMATSGSWPGIAGPDGNAPVGYYTNTYLTTRTLKRRGRRPT